MKSILILLILLTLYCNTDERKKKEEENLKLLGLVIATNMNYQSQSCRSYYGESNYLFPHSQYYPTFSAKKTGFTNSIIGDSTMDISSSYTGWLSSTSVSYAVSGNTMCDMLEQFNTLNPSVNNAIIATNGGNDLLRKVPIDRIDLTGKELINTINTKKIGKLAVIGIHPTRVDYANNNRNDLNNRIKTYTESIGGCYVGGLDDLIPLDSEGRASQSYMLDSIHYNESVSNGVKSKLNSICGISL